jgi:hypothetical protein
MRDATTEATLGGKSKQGWSCNFVGLGQGRTCERANERQLIRDSQNTWLTPMSLLDSSFNLPVNNRPRSPKPKAVLALPTGTRFEDRAFAALWSNRKELGIARLWRCSAARVDGFLETTGGETILLEMKETLGFGATQAASFQFLVGRRLLSLKATKHHRLLTVL